MFDVKQLRAHGVGDDGLRRWTVALPGLSYDGKALAPADWTAGQVLDALLFFASRTSYEVACGRLYSPLTLEARRQQHDR